MDRRRLLQRGVVLVGGLLPAGPVVQAAKLFATGARSMPGCSTCPSSSPPNWRSPTWPPHCGEAAPAALAHARSLTRLLANASMTDTSRRRLAGIASDAAALVGHTHLNDGRLAVGTVIEHVESVIIPHRRYAYVITSR